jgi:hypothetical protein
MEQSKCSTHEQNHNEEHPKEVAVCTTMDCEQRQTEDHLRFPVAYHTTTCDSGKIVACTSQTETEHASSAATTSPQQRPPSLQRSRNVVSIGEDNPLLLTMLTTGNELTEETNNGEPAAVMSTRDDDSGSPSSTLSEVFFPMLPLATFAPFEGLPQHDEESVEIGTSIQSTSSTRSPGLLKQFEGFDKTYSNPYETLGLMKVVPLFDEQAAAERFMRGMQELANRPSDFPIAGHQMQPAEATAAASHAAASNDDDPLA